VSRSMQNHLISNATSRPLDSNALNIGPRTLGMRNAGSRITALNVEFVAKPNEAHRVHATLPAAINSALGEVDGFAGSFVMIANHEARLVTVVTLWSGEDRMQRCSENVRWVRALLTPYLDRCLRVQTLAAYVPTNTPQVSEEFEKASSEGAMQADLGEVHAMCVA
jgi:hypothetical protein